MSPLTNIILPMAMILGQALATSGDMTFYYPGLGSCGSTNSNNDAVVALSPSDQQNNCGRSIIIYYDDKTITAQVADTCPGCAEGSIDVSPSVFGQLADLDAGRVRVDWQFA